MKKVLILLCCIMLISSYSSYASGPQNLKIKWGQEYQLPKKAVEVGFIGNTKVGYTEISSTRGKTINLQKFNPDLKLTNTNMVSTKDFPKGYMMENLSTMDGKNFLYYSTWVKKEGTEHLFAQEIDPVKGEFKGDAKEMISASKIAGTLVLTGYFHYGTADKWKFVFSADSSMMMVYYRLKPTEKRDAKNKDLIGMFVFDKAQNKVWGREIEMPYTEKMMDNEDYQVDRNGNAYILAKVYNSEAKRKDKDDYHYEVLSYDKDSKKPVISSFKFSDKYIVDIALNEDHNGRMVCTGYYSKSGAGTDGAFFLGFDAQSKTMKNIHKGFYEFPTELMREYESKKTKKKSEKKAAKGEDEEVSNLEFRNLNLGNDGSITMFGEQYTYWVTITQSKNSVTYTYHHNFGDIYVMRIDADGEMKWVKKIPKVQLGTTRNNPDPSHLGLSFHLHTIGDDSYLFFVDNIKNLEIKKEDAPAAHIAGMGGVLMGVKVGGDGAVSKTNIFDFREEKMNVDVSAFSDVSENQILGRARKLKGPFQFNFTEGKPLLITVN